ncbi:MAG: SPASM domain-containing protein [Candidatus Bruticola sp.]
MLNLVAPVSCNIILASEACTAADTLSFQEWSAILDQLGAANEFRVYGFERWFSLRQEVGETAENVLSWWNRLDSCQKCFHVYFDGSVALEKFPSSLWAALLNCSYLGSVVFCFSGQRALAEEPGWTLLENAAAAGFDTEVSILLTEYSALSIEELTNEALDGGASLVIFERLSPAESGELSLESLRRSAEQIKELRQLGVEVAMSGCFPNCFSKGDIPSCLAGTVSCAITPDGMLRPCRYVDSSGCLSLVHNSLTAAWRSDAFINWRRISSESCQQCNKCNLCPGGCLLYAYKSGGQDKDPLISETETEETILQEVTLEDELCPVPCYNIRAEEFGWLLMRGSRVVPVSPKAASVLARFDGRTTLGQIEEEFGSGALSFIYSLYVRGFVEFKDMVALGEDS